MNYFIGAAMGEETRVLLTLFIMLAAAKFMAELFERLRQPAVAGEIIAGILIGPSLLNLAAPSEITSRLRTNWSTSLVAFQKSVVSYYFGSCGSIRFFPPQLGTSV
ncbi:MAG TPA: cation:proton antiporter [Pyrinomonadaceae bacterium]